MVDEVITRQELIDAQKDAQSLDDFINGGDEQIVVTRLLKEYPTLANAIRQIYEKGGKFYPTLAAANADIANIRTDVYVITGDNGAYYKATAEAASLTKSPYDPVEQAKSYTDTAKSSAISTAASDATTKANTAKSEAISASATDATTKANAAKAEAITAASSDATTKADTAEVNANNYTDSKTPSKHITKGIVFSIADDSGNSIATLEDDGTLKVPAIEDANGPISSELQPKENISAYAYGIADENGNPILKIKKDGTLVVGSVEDKNGVVGSSGVPLDKIFNNVSQLDIFINHGQSNGSGGVPTTPPVTDTQKYNNWLLNGGDISDLVIASDKPETPGYNAMNHLTTMTLRDTDLNLDELSSRKGVFSIAESGTGIVALYSPDRSAFLGFTNSLIKIKAYCDTNNITCNVKAMLFTHGEFDAGTMTVDEYLGHQYALYDAFNSEAKKITGQKNDMKFLTWDLGPNNAGKAQIKASRQHPNMLVAFPKYCGFFGDGAHYDAIGTALAGAYYAKAYRYYFEQGKHWQPLMHISCEKYGANAVKVKFNRSGLTFDSSRFSATGGGFYGTDSSGALTVNSYIVDQNDSVIVTFNRDIVGDLTFGYGRQLVRTDTGNNFGGTLRDNEGLFETTMINGTEYPLHNWALSFEEIVK